MQATTHYKEEGAAVRLGSAERMVVQENPSFSTAPRDNGMEAGMVRCSPGRVGSPGGGGGGEAAAAARLVAAASERSAAADAAPARQRSWLALPLRLLGRS